MRYALAVALLGVLCVPSYCSADGTEPDRAHSIVPGAFAAQVELKTEPDTAFEDGLNLAFKHQRWERSALRLGVHYRWRSLDESRAQNFFPETGTESVGSRGREEHFWSLAFDLLWIRYAEPGKLVNIYWGLGPSGGYSSSDGVLDNDTGDPALFAQTQSRAATTWFVGGTALLGIEWFAIERASLYMEYRTSLEYSSRSDDVSSQRINGDRTVEDIDRELWSVSSSAVLIGLAAYF